MLNMNELTLTPEDIREIIPMVRKQLYKFVNKLPYKNKIGGRIYVAASRFMRDLEAGNFDKILERRSKPGEVPNDEIK